MGESYNGICALADFIRDVTKYQQWYRPQGLGRDVLLLGKKLASRTLSDEVLGVG